MKLNDFPTFEHDAVLIFRSTSVYHEGDERSRTNPGHGYPAYTETIESIDYKVFATRAELETWLQGREALTAKYRIIHAVPLKAITKVELSQ